MQVTGYYLICLIHLIEHPFSFYVTSCNETINHKRFTCERK